MASLIPAERIEKRILFLRGHKVILDKDLAELYEVEVKQLKRQVRRNLDRFPEDFMFELSKPEQESLRSHFGTLKRGEHSKYLPYAFTEQGVAMLSSVLRSKRAVRVNVEIMRAFVRLREVLATHKDLARKLEALEKRYDSQFKVVFDAIRQLMTPPEPKKRKIGFLVKERAVRYGRGYKWPVLGPRKIARLSYLNPAPFRLTSARFPGWLEPPPSVRPDPTSFLTSTICSGTLSIIS